MARGQHQVLLASGAVEGTQGQLSVTAGRYFVFYLVQDATTANWSAKNPTNSMAVRPLMFTSIAQGNPDAFDHVHETITADKVQLAWEDLEFGGDMSFRDIIAEATFSAGQPNYCRAVDDVFSLQAESGRTTLDLLANDQSRDPARITQVTQPAFGSVAIGATGREVIVTPAPGHYGPLTFQYTIQSGDLTSKANVQLSVSKRWTNPSNAADVNNDGKVTALDALTLINILNTDLHAVTTPYPQGEQANWGMADVNADGLITVLDALLVITKLL